MNIKEIQIRLQRFAEERDWDQFHTPKNLSMALAGEAGELVEIFQWLTDQQSIDLKNDEIYKKSVEEEIADVFIYLIRLADKLEIDLEKSVEHKIAKNTIKYPIDIAKGNAIKYNKR